MLYMNIKLVKPKIHSAVLQYILPLLFLFLFAIGAKAQSTENVEKASLFSKVETWYADNMNYGTITVLMAAESSIFPVPSELVVPPAVYIASRDDVTSAAAPSTSPPSRPNPPALNQIGRASCRERV
mgnify:CR=1 FL=1